VEVSAFGVSATGTVYEIGGQRFEVATSGFAQAIANAHAARQRPRCQCTPEGVEMYVARLAGPHRGYIVKRMPDTGCRHACDCPSYEPPADLSCLGPVLGTAINEDPATGQTNLRLGFSLTKLPGRSQMPTEGGESESVCTDGTKLSLRGLLHYLWDQAELTHWKPGFAGRRNWATVRRHLLQAAENIATHGQPLLVSLYIPEVFSVEQRDAIHTRHRRQWSRAIPRPGQPQPLMLMVAEVKEIAPSRYGHTAILKHIPDQAFTLDESLYRRLGRCFERELTLWGTEADLHLIVMATFRLDEAGAPAIVEMTLMLATAQWLPVEDAWERQLINALVRNGRSFIKGLRYNSRPVQALASVSLLDCGIAAHPLFIDRDHRHGDALAQGFATLDTDENPPAWRWLPADGDMPALPPQQLWQPAAPLP
jgi:hypothetical protein